ncbi:hypothetical protein [Bordetella petrii]|uniref:hypothetical protein n=1 Tax=Bordetella petrii TaxID=94624 RepID=UPI00372F1E79
MSASPATSSNRAASSAGWSGHRPLSAIAAAAGGGVPQARIRRVLQDLAEPLAQLHGQGQVHGAIAMSTIGLDAAGRAHLLVPPLEPAPDAEGTLRIDGYSAFEQYTDDPERPCGPWTDVYALSAVAHTMVVGAAPPAALARCVKDTYVPLAGRDLGAYDADFLRAVDQGLSMNPQARPQTVAALATAFGLAVARPEAPAAPPAAGAAAEPTAPSVPPPPRSEPGPRLPLLVMLGVLAAVALAVYLWLRPGMQPPAQQAARDTAAPPPAEAPVPTPPALSDLNTRPAPSDNTGPVPGPGTGPGGPAAPEAVPAPQQPPAAAVPAPAVPPAATAPTPDAAPAIPPGEPPGTAAQPPVVPGQPPTATAPPDAAPDPAAGAPAGALPGAAPGQPGTADPADSADPAGPAAADEPKPPEPAPPASAEIRIHVQPWGEVLVDGRSRGISPPLNRLSLSPGRHQITIRNPAASDYHTTVNVSPGGSASVSHVFE